MIGFFGGSFDPVHYGHLKNAQAIKAELGLTQLFLMPCNAPVHKNKLHFSIKQRLDMLSLALSEFPDLSIDLQEVEQQTPAYTIDTLKNIKKNHPQQQIFLIMGSDSFSELHTWKNFKQLSHYAKLAVLPRKGYSYDVDEAVYFAKTPLFEVSSTQIRSKITQHQNLSGLLPENVIEYIKSIPKSL